MIGPEKPPCLQTRYWKRVLRRFELLAVFAATCMSGNEGRIGKVPAGVVSGDSDTVSIRALLKNLWNAALLPLWLSMLLDIPGSWLPMKAGL
jgi:hypothetical protein